MLKFSPVQSIFRTELCPGLELFFIYFLLVENAPYSTGPEQGHRHSRQFMRRDKAYSDGFLVNPRVCVHALVQDNFIQRIRGL